MQIFVSGMACTSFVIVSLLSVLVVFVAICFFLCVVRTSLLADVKRATRYLVPKNGNLFLPERVKYAPKGGVAVSRTPQSNEIKLPFPCFLPQLSAVYVYLRFHCFIAFCLFVFKSRQSSLPPATDRGIEGYRGDWYL